MSCDWTEKISLLIDGELPPAEARAIEQHLLTCSECDQTHRDFLGLRGRISAYVPLLDPSATHRALAQVLSNHGPARQETGTIGVGARNRFLEAFGTYRFNPALASVAALLVVGAIAFVIYRTQRNVFRGEQAPTTLATASSPSPIPTDSQSARDGMSGDRGRKPLKAEQRETFPNKKPNSRTKPTRERIAPKPSPQRRYETTPPPTYAAVDKNVAPVAAANRPAEARTLTARHLEQSEVLLRAFRNISVVKPGATSEMHYERRRAQQLLYQNIMLRREADAAGDVQVATLLGSLEPILLDIANLRDRPHKEEMTAIKARVERKSLVALLQINSTAVARANE